MASRADHINVIESLEPIRRRPTMYIGEATADHSLCSRLVECVVGSVATDDPAPTAVRMLLWSDNVVSVAFDGTPLPIAPYADSRSTIPHPELYRLFRFIGLQQRLSHAGGIVNALSQRLTVSTRHGGVSYRASFRTGGLVSLLSEGFGEVLGTSWMTFKPDAGVVPGLLSLEVAAAIAARVAKDAPGVSIAVVDRRAEPTSWG